MLLPDNGTNIILFYPVDTLYWSDLFHFSHLNQWRNIFSHRPQLSTQSELVDIYALNKLKGLNFLHRALVQWFVSHSFQKEWWIGHTSQFWLLWHGTCFSGSRKGKSQILRLWNRMHQVRQEVLWRFVWLIFFHILVNYLCGNFDSVSVQFLLENSVHIPTQVSSQVLQSMLPLFHNKTETNYTFEFFLNDFQLISVNHD